MIRIITLTLIALTLTGCAAPAQAAPVAALSAPDYSAPVIDISAALMPLSLMAGLPAHAHADALGGLTEAAEAAWWASYADLESACGLTPDPAAAPAPEGCADPAIRGRMLSLLAVYPQHLADTLMAPDYPASGL